MRVLRLHGLRYSVVLRQCICLKTQYVDDGDALVNLTKEIHYIDMTAVSISGLFYAFQDSGVPCYFPTHPAHTFQLHNSLLLLILETYN